MTNYAVAAAAVVTQNLRVLNLKFVTFVDAFLPLDSLMSPMLMAATKVTLGLGKYRKKFHIVS